MADIKNLSVTRNADATGAQITALGIVIPNWTVTGQVVSSSNQNTVLLDFSGGRRVGVYVQGMPDNRLADLLGQLLPFALEILAGQG